MSLIVNVILLESLPLAFSVPATDKTQYFVDLGFNSTLQLINGFFSNLQKLLEHFNGTVITKFLRIPLAAFG